MNFTPWETLFAPARVIIIAGHYGSGKSEIAVQYARSMAQSGRRVLLADMDIVNPFFRSLDAKNVLEAEGIRVTAPMFANTNVDVPALVPEVTNALWDAQTVVVLDVGGDGDGARVLGRYHKDIQPEEVAMVFVFNASRPMTRTAATAAVQMEEIEFASRQRFTHILNNTHLLQDTDARILAEGECEAVRLSALRHCPLAGTVVAIEPSSPLAPASDAGAEGIPRLPLMRTLGVSFG